jgi:hypothetical protein
VTRPDAWEYVLGRLDALVSEYAIDLLKWDHNRDLHEAVHDGVAGVRRQTLATYRLLDELRRRHCHPAISPVGGGHRHDPFPRGSASMPSYSTVRTPSGAAPERNRTLCKAEACPGPSYEARASWNFTSTSLGMRPRSLTSIPCALAHSRTS